MRPVSLVETTIQNSVKPLVERKSSIAKKVIKEDRYTISRAIRIGYISEHLERIADHGTNIAEMGIHMCKGNLGRHKNI